MNNTSRQGGAEPRTVVSRFLTRSECLGGQAYLSMSGWEVHTSRTGEPLCGPIKAERTARPAKSAASSNFPFHHRAALRAIPFYRGITWGPTNDSAQSRDACWRVPPIFSLLSGVLSPSEKLAASDFPARLIRSLSLQISAPTPHRPARHGPRPAWPQMSVKSVFLTSRRMMHRFSHTNFCSVNQSIPRQINTILQSSSIPSLNRVDQCQAPTASRAPSYRQFLLRADTSS